MSATKSRFHASLAAAQPILTQHGERVRSVLESETSSRPAEGTEMRARSRPSGRERSTVTVRHESRRVLR
ncbi:hypothetical protein GPN2_10038 [Streptomyces murinus]